MAENYDPVPDLALLLDAALRGGRDGSAYAERIAERLELDPDAGPKAAGRLLRTALGLPACECPVGGGGTVLPLACPVDGEIIDTYGGEHYWQCGRPGTVTVPSGRLLCEDHAGELGYGPKQEEYGYEPDDAFTVIPGQAEAAQAAGTEVNDD